VSAVTTVLLQACSSTRRWTIFTHFFYCPGLPGAAKRP
jgi:hypothetical protein